MEKITEQVFFTEIGGRIKECFENAKKEIRIAICWMNDLSLLNTLIDLAEIISISIVVNESEILSELQEIYSRMVKSGVKVFTHNNSRLMHNKYTIIDEKLVITGSYNYTNGAKQNEENIVMLNDRQSIKKFIENFENLLSHSIPIDLGKVYTSKLDMSKCLVGDFDIPSSSNIPTKIVDKAPVQQKTSFNFSKATLPIYFSFHVDSVKSYLVTDSLKFGENYKYEDEFVVQKGYFFYLVVSTGPHVGDTNIIWQNPHTFKVGQTIKVSLELEITARGGFIGMINIAGYPHILRMSLYDVVKDHRNSIRKK